MNKIPGVRVDASNSFDTPLFERIETDFAEIQENKKLSEVKILRERSSSA